MKQSSEGTGTVDEGAAATAVDATRGYGIWESFNIRIEGELAKYPYALEDGDLSEGVMIAGRFQRAKGGGSE